MLTDPTERFSSRVEDYVRYRPSYPGEIIGLLGRECGLEPGSVIADIGCGTGQLAKLFLENGNPVYGVEPNPEMRQAGEAILQNFRQFHSVAGRAEATTLEKASIDFVAAGQAFHWFDHARARQEFLRILKPAGWVVLVWNDRRLGATPFLQIYEQLLLEYGTDYSHVKEGHHIDKTVLPEFFGRSGFRRASFENLQQFDLEGLKGRLRSASYIPGRDHPRHAAMMKDLEKIFYAHQVNGKVNFEHDTRVYYERLAPR